MKHLTITLVVGALLLAAIYALLGFLHIIPAQFNVFASDKAAAEQPSDEMLAPQEELVLSDDGSSFVQKPNPMTEVLEEVKSYTLPNGYTLKDFIDAKHPATRDLITWEIATAVDPDNYSVLVKVPPENPQSFKISYRFNYNAVTKTLEPTISDAKNLLDSASSGLSMTPVEIQ